MPIEDRSPQQARIINTTPNQVSDFTMPPSERSAMVLHAEKLPGIDLAPNSTLFFFRDPQADVSRLSKEQGIRTLQERGVSIQGDTIRIISTLSNGRNFLSTPDVVEVKSKAVADLVEGALERALAGGLTPKEARQLEALRQEVADRGKDGTFDKDDIKAIRTRADKISPNAVGRG